MNEEKDIYDLGYLRSKDVKMLLLSSDFLLDAMERDDYVMESIYHHLRERLKNKYWDILGEVIDENFDYIKNEYIQRNVRRNYGQIIARPKVDNDQLTFINRKEDDYVSIPIDDCNSIKEILTRVKEEI